MGGTVSYDWQNEQVGTRPNGRPLYRKEPAAPAWLRRWLGDEPFQAVTTVSLGEFVPPEALPGVLAEVGRFGRLERFFLRRAAGAGDGLRHLRGLGRLKTVWVAGPGITDAMLADLAAIPSLRELAVGRSTIIRERAPDPPGDSPSDAAFARLAALTKLEQLMVERCPNLTDATLARLIAAPPALRYFSLRDGGPPSVAATLAALGRCSDLAGLDLDQSTVTDANLAAVAGLTKLRSIHLQGTRVGDAGVDHLRGLTNLVTVMLNNSAVGDRGLKVLGGLTGLIELGVNKTRVTDAGMTHVAGLRNLTHLSLGLNDLTDATTPPLAGLTKLENLTLYRLPGLTDAGLVPLRSLTRLKALNVAETKVTPEGVAALQQAIPSLTRVTTRLARPAASPPPTPAPAAK